MLQEMDCEALFTAERGGGRGMREGEGGGEDQGAAEMRVLRHHFSQQTKTFAGISIWS